MPLNANGLFEEDFLRGGGCIILLVEFSYSGFDGDSQIIVLSHTENASNAYLSSDWV